MSTKYDQHGNEYETITQLPNGSWVARPVYEDSSDGEPTWTGDPEVIDCTLFDEPPHAKVDAELAAKRAELATLQQAVRDLRAEQKRIETEGKTMLERIKQHAGLELLDQYLAGKITHFVVADYGPPKILTFEQAMAVNDDYGRREKDMKLLCLFGSSGGDLTWQVNRYRDGSGGWTVMTPCLSFEDAVNEARQLFAEHENAVLVDGEHNRLSRSWVDAAVAIGLQLSRQYVDALEQKESDAKQAEIDRLQKKLAELTAV